MMKKAHSSHDLIEGLTPGEREFLFTAHHLYCRAPLVYLAAAMLFFETRDAGTLINFETFTRWVRLVAVLLRLANIEEGRWAGTKEKNARQKPIIDYLVFYVEANESFKKILPKLKNNNADPDQLETGIICLDLKSQIFFVRGVLRGRLSNTLFEILKFFMEHEGVEFSMADLKAKLWAHKSDISDQAVSRTVHKLRKLLGRARFCIEVDRQPRRFTFYGIPRVSRESLDSLDKESALLN
ncbi:MAG: helix-turn-helix domain-containing protein [Elusimicrobia bacterium]|nr:helix-turn-helix domain-containing protein [Elusimicrobiota bacterium]